MIICHLSRVSALSQALMDIRNPPMVVGVASIPDPRLWYAKGLKC